MSRSEAAHTQMFSYRSTLIAGRMICSCATIDCSPALNLCEVHPSDLCQGFHVGATLPVILHLHINLRQDTS